MANFSSSFIQNRNKVLGINSNDQSQPGSSSSAFTPQNSPQRQIPLPSSNANFGSAFAANRARVIASQSQPQPTPTPTPQPQPQQTPAPPVSTGLLGTIMSKVTQMGQDIYNSITHKGFSQPTQPEPVVNPGKINPTIAPDLTGPQAPASAQVTNTPQSRMQAKQTIDRMTQTNAQAAKLMPTTIAQMKELNVDPFSLKVNPTKAFSDALNTIKSSYANEWSQMAKLGSTLRNPKATTSQKVGAGLEAGVSQINFVLSPLSAIFNGANQIPVLGTVSKLLTLPFTAVGEGATGVSNKIIDKLPISQTAKNNIKPGMGEIFSLAAQIALGKIGEVSAKKVGALEQRFGTKDAQTIIDQSQKLGMIARSKNITRTVLPPEHLQAETARPSFSETPAAQILNNHAQQAQTMGQHVAIDFNPKPEDKTAIAEKAPNGKSFAVSLVKPEKTIGELQQEHQSPDLTAYEKAFNSGDTKTLDELAAKHPDNTSFHVHEKLGATPANPVAPTSREIIKLDKTQYKGMQGASVIVRPNGTASLDLHFLPEGRGQGQGTRAVKELEGIAQAKGAIKVNIAAFTEAKGFWEKQGYKEVPNAPTKSSLLVKMQKDLTAKPEEPVSTKNIEPSVVQIVDTKTNNIEYKTIPQGQLPDFHKAIDETGQGIAGKEINGKIYHLTAKTPEQMDSAGAKFTGQADIKDIPRSTGTNEALAKQNLTPIGEGETKTSKLALGVEEKAVEAKLAKNLSTLPEYKTLNMKEQAASAVKFLEENPEKAMQVALGKEIPPAHITPEAIFTAVENRALKNKDLSTIQKLATSQLTTEATAMGQRIRTLAERDPNSPVSIMKDVVKSRQTSLEKKTGKSVAKVTEATVKEIKAKVKAPDRYSWENFIDSLAC